MSTTILETRGPFCYKNWKAALAGSSWLWIFEFPLFTDAHIIGEIGNGLGPYQIINAGLNQTNRPALMLRVHQHLNFDKPLMTKTQAQSYHGGDEVDEIAALLSLCLGIRVKAGGASRIFGKDGDPMGRPISFGYGNPDDPNLFAARPRLRRPILKNALEEHSLDKANIMATLPSLSEQDANALIRAARMYQEAVWIIETTPELSWIMLVSAIEIVANQWRARTIPDIIHLQESSKLAGILRKYCEGDQYNQLIAEVAQELAPSLKATKRFLNFLREFLPSYPSTRPAPFAQVSWEADSIEKALRKIYDYRSIALHEGIPFPWPMCQPPVEAGEHDEFAEIPLGLATSTKGAVWVAEDLPMLLHPFEYIVRNAILNWWRKISPQEAGEQ